MKISYDVLWETLKRANINQTKMKNDLKLPGSTIQKLRHNESTTLETIKKICEYLRCDINEVVEILPDDFEKTETESKFSKACENYELKETTVINALKEYFAKGNCKISNDGNGYYIE